MNVSERVDSSEDRSRLYGVTKWLAIAAAVILPGILASRPLVACVILLLAIPASRSHALLMLGVAGTGYLGHRFGGDFPWWASIFAVQLINVGVVRFAKRAPFTGRGSSWRVFYIVMAALSAFGFLFESLHPLRTSLVVGAWLAAAYAQPRTQTPLRELAANAALLVISLSLSVALVEGALRLGPAPEQVYLPGDGTLVADPEYFFTLPIRDEHTVRFVPDVDGAAVEFDVAINPPGIRNEPVPPKAPEEFRIGLIGDSFTFGWGLEYEDTIGQQLETLLNDAQTVAEVRVINLGVPGYGPWQEIAFLEQRGFPLELDAVIIQLFPSNDLENELSREGKVFRSYFTFWQERLNAWRAFATWQLAVERWFRNHSRIYRMLYDYAPGWNLVYLLNDFRFSDPAPTLPLPPNEGRPSTLEPLHSDEFEEVEEAWRLILESLTTLAERCEARDIETAGYVIPMYQQMGDAAWQALLEELPPDYNAEIERFKDVEDAERVLGRAGIAVIPVADALRAVPNPQAIYFTHDTHLRASGAKLVAETIAEYVLGSGMLPSEAE